MTEWIEGIPHLDAEELHHWLADPSKEGVYVIDVREPHEYAAGHIPGVPLIPMGHIPEVVEKLDKDAKYVFICQGGVRSLQVAKYLQHHGFSNVYNFKGGMSAWDKEVRFGDEHIVASDLTEMSQLRRKKESEA
jgi:rhodanese-related sulfurtransferase